jgi:hypothetical protein
LNVRTIPTAGFEHGLLVPGAGLHALLVTAGLAVATTSYRWRFWFTVLQTVGYAILFVVGAGLHTWFASPANDVLHAAIALVGLVLLMWAVGRRLGGEDRVHRSAVRTRQSGQ